MIIFDVSYIHNNYIDSLGLSSLKIPQKKAGEGDEEETGIERDEPYSESALFILDPTILHSTIMSPAAVACSLPSCSARYHLSLTNLVKPNCLFLREV